MGRSLVQPLSPGSQQRSELSSAVAPPASETPRLLSNCSRRVALAGLAAALAAGLPAAGAAPAAAAAAPPQPGTAAAFAEAVVRLQSTAAEAYAARDFATAIAALNELVAMQPRELRWREMRAQALVDGKDFPRALADFDFTLKQLPADAEVDRARLLSGRGLAYEGVGDWVAALHDYEAALSTAAAAGMLPDPYIQNSLGNCHASLGEWQQARDSFLASAGGFGAAVGFRRGRSTTPRLDGQVFAQSNAALMLAQLGDEEGALREMEAIARKAPGSVDMRAALAALLWRRGDEAAAEGEWDWACTKITTGCTKYQDQDWLARIRRWPPVMVDAMQQFLQLRSSGSGGDGRASRARAGAGFRE